MSRPTSTPPKWADHFLRWFCAEDLLEEIQGDLHEAYYHRAKAQGHTRASLQYIQDVFQFFGPYAFEKYSNTKQFLPMFDNYFKIALRNILHRKSFTAINFLGLAFGMAAIMLIGIYIHNEWTYDQHIPEHERIFRLVNNYRDQTYTNMSFNGYNDASSQTQLQLVEHLRQYEDIQEACHFMPSQSDVGGDEQYYVELDGKRFIAENILYTNTGMAFQQMFPQQFLMGNPEMAFSAFGKVTITQKLAEIWFGEDWKNQALIGKNLTVRGETFELAGVIANVLGNTHYTFDWIIHQQQIPGWGAYTYFKLQPNAQVSSTMKRLNSELDIVYPGYSKDVLQKGVKAMALADIHFTSGNLYELKPTANKAYLSTFGLVGLVILLIIWTNYTNLSVAMYADRQKEIGVRKVIGARPLDISFQLIAEALLLALLCFPLCLFLLYYTFPFFNDLMGINIPTSAIFSPGILLSLLALLLVSGLLSSLYPALTYGQRSMPRLFGKKHPGIMGNRYFNFRNVLVTAQFIMVVGLLSMTYFIHQQLQYINSKDLGYQKEGIVYFGIESGEKYQQLKRELSTITGIQAVGANGVPGSDMYNQLTYKMKDTDLTLSDGTNQYVDLGSLRALNIPCEACKALDEGKERLFVINQTAAEKLAKIKGITAQELVGETLVSEPEWENETFGYGVHKVIDGIIPDFKYFSLKYPNQSLLIDIVKEPNYAYEVLVRANTSDWPRTIQQIKTAYLAVETQKPFDIHFLSERLDQLYNNERRSGVLMSSLTIVAIILALMGLAGIVSYMAYSRQKEIGIRKILGASVHSILYAFNKEFIILMGIATMVSMPFAIYLASIWLESFAFSIQPQFWVVLLAGLVALLLVVVLVSIQARRAAQKKPVEVLRFNA